MRRLVLLLPLYALLISAAGVCAVADSSGADSSGADSSGSSASAPLKPYDTGRFAQISARPNPDGLVIVFMPSLAATLTAADKKAEKGLDERQAIAVRDSAPVVALRKENAAAIEKERGYPDADPADCFNSWKRVTEKSQ